MRHTTSVSVALIRIKTNSKSFIREKHRQTKKGAAILQVLNPATQVSGLQSVRERRIEQDTLMTLTSIFMP